MYKAQVSLCQSFSADVPDHSKPSRSVMIVTKSSDRGLNSRSLSVQDYQYDLSTTAVRRWYDGCVWPALSTFSTTTDTIDTTAHTMLTITPNLLPELRRPNRLKNDPVMLLATFRRLLYATYDHQYVTGTIWPTIATTMYRLGWSPQSASIDSGKVVVWFH